MKVVLADKSATIRSALRLVVEMETDLEIAGEAASGEELKALMSSPPMLAVIDWDLPGLEKPFDGNGKKDDGSRLIVIANDPRVRGEALDGGAHYFVSKGEAPERLLAAIREAMAGAGADPHRDKGADGHMTNG